MGLLTFVLGGLLIGVGVIVMLFSPPFVVLLTGSFLLATLCAVCGFILILVGQYLMRNSRIHTHDRLFAREMAEAISEKQSTAEARVLSEVKFCPNCGTSLSTPNPNFCPNCGLKFKVVDDKSGTPPFQTRPEKSPIQIENVKLTKTDGRAFFVLEIRNVSNKTATNVEVTPPFGSPTIIDLPGGGLKPSQTTKHTATLVGDYNVGNTYVIVVKAFYNDGTTSSVVVSARCVW